MLVFDPVCSTELEDTEAAATYTYGGETFHFCSEDCRDRFIDSPGDYLDELDRWQAQAGELRPE